MTRQGYDCYVLYLALQRHFSTEYDFFKYNGKIKASVQAYEKRNDVFSFEKLVKIIPEKDQVDFFICHFLENPTEWIRNMDISNLDAFKSKYARLLTTFENDLYTIYNNGVQRCFDASDKSNIPLIYNMMLSGDVEIETLIIIDEYIHKFIDNHSQNIDVPFVFPDTIKKIKKYKPFVIKKIETNYNSYVSVARKVLLN